MPRQRIIQNMPTSFAGTTMPWHRICEPLSEEESRDIDVAMEKGGLNFKVLKRKFAHPFAAEMAATGIMDADEVFTYGLFNGRNFRQIGQCKEDYTVIDNRECFAFLEDLIAEGMRIDSCGALKHGQVVFANVLAYEDEIVKGDPVKRYAQFLSSHNGQYGLKYFSSLTQMVCTNTIRHAMKMAEVMLNFYHSKNAKTKLANAKEMLTLSNQEMRSFDEKLRFLATKRLTDDMVKLVLDRLIGEVSEEDKTERRKNMREAILAAPDNSDKVRGIAGTAYALLNQITWEVDNRMPKTAQELKSYNETKRAISASFGSGAEKKTKAFQLIFDAANGKEI